ncbi:MAG: hypothetical protein AABY22_26055 [Nanoarchaeota archaeon]
MKIYKLKNMKDGWFLGNFKPTVYKIEQVECCYRIHKKGEYWPKHFHKKTIEINLLIKGKMKICGKIINKNDIFVIKPFEIAKPEYLQDCHIFIVRIPSIPDDKFIIK